jgi:hypothetical protein
VSSFLLTTFVFLASLSSTTFGSTPLVAMNSAGLTDGDTEVPVS